jgi:fused signal recognition particle receptor
VEKSTWRQALARTRQTALGRMAHLLGSTELDENFWDSLEASLIQADLGVEQALEVVSSAQERARKQGFTQGEQVQGIIRELLLDKLDSSTPVLVPSSPQVTILVGVNGSGKTTTAARLAYHFQQRDQRVLLAAADTYRAAAAEQLEAWGQRLSIDVVTGPPGSDPGAVVFNAGEAARARHIDQLIVDTSGRMHTEHNLMAELSKIVRVAGKVVEGAPHETLLVLDAVTGQNGLSQATAFAEAIPLTGVVLAKLDSSAKGGVAFAVSNTLALPIRYIGLGETIASLTAFEPEKFVNSFLNDHDEEQG